MTGPDNRTTDADRPTGRSRRVGERVRVVFCTDPYTRLRPGTEGTIRFVDDMGTVHIDWDDGTHLGLVTEAGDVYEVIDPVA